MKTKSLKAILLLAFFSFSILSGCIQKEKPTTATNNKRVELVYYKLFDDEDAMQPLIAKYQSSHPNVIIRYKKFTDPIEYQNLILNELAEGQGPDLFSAPNYWFLRNAKKLNPLALTKMNPQQFDQTFVNVASNDLVFIDPIDGQKRVFALPLSVDTLALYYNKSIYEDAVPSRGRPAATWEELKNDVYQITKKDNSYERFKLAGVAMGRADNVARAVDILYLLMLQFKANFYNDNLSKASFAEQQIIGSSGLGINPGAEALKLFTSFADSEQKNYSWNEYLADSKSGVKDLETFAKGKVAMVFGYSYLYEQIKAQIKELKAKGVETIDPNDVRVSVVPQVQDPATSQDKRGAYATYYAETVARTSAHPEEAWDFLMFLSSKDSLEVYNQKTHRPTSRRDMIDQQKRDTIYGAFAEQIGFAESFPIMDDQAYNVIFSDAISSFLASGDAVNVIQRASDKITNLLPQGGLVLGKQSVGTSQNSKSSSQANQKPTAPANK